MSTYFKTVIVSNLDTEGYSTALRKLFYVKAMALEGEKRVRDRYKKWLEKKEKLVAPGRACGKREALSTSVICTLINLCYYRSTGPTVICTWERRT